MTLRLSSALKTPQPVFSKRVEAAQRNMVFYTRKREKEPELLGAVSLFRGLSFSKHDGSSADLIFCYQASIPDYMTRVRLSPQSLGFIRPRKTM